MGREDEIRVMAFKLWEEEGCIDGKDCEHWFRAEIIWEQQQKAAKSNMKESKLADTKNAAAPTKNKLRK